MCDKYIYILKKSTMEATMSKNNYEPESQDYLNAFNDMSFLPEKAIDENYGRDFPKIHTGEKYFRLSWLILVACAAITYLVFLFICGTGVVSWTQYKGYYFKGDNGYGIAGIIVTALFVVAFTGMHTYSYFYDTSLSNVKDEKKKNLYKVLSTSSLYLAFALLYTMIFFTTLRPVMVQKFFNTYNNWFLNNLGIFTYVILLLVSVGGVLLKIFKPTASKFYDYFVLVVGPWVVVFFANIITRQFNNYANLFFILGAIMADLSAPFLIAQKKTACRSIFHILLSGAAVFEVLAILLYCM